MKRIMMLSILAVFTFDTFLIIHHSCKERMKKAKERIKSESVYGIISELDVARKPIRSFSMINYMVINSFLQATVKHSASYI